MFWVPKVARRSYLQANTKQPTISKLLDDAMVAIEKENPTLKFSYQLRNRTNGFSPARSDFRSLASTSSATSARSAGGRYHAGAAKSCG